MKHWFIFLFGILVSNQLYAQTMVIKSVSLQPLDKTAIEHPFLDNNGDTCALIKIQTDHLEGIQFSNPNQYVKTSYSNGVYYVYVPTISRKLDFLHKDYMPLQLDMSTYGYRGLKNGKVYQVVLDAPRISELKSSVIIKVIPTESKITFDNKEYIANQTGTLEVPVSAGRHSYTVSLSDHVSQSASITIGKSEVKTLSVRLQPIMHEIIVGSNIGNARVFVDNIDYGNVGKILIPQGKHRIRVQADGYVDREKDISINASTGSISFILEENKKITHIHATPVTIYSKSSCVYKNNKKIKEWRNGATIMFMPGKYLLSDDYGNSQKIVVDDKPIEIRL